MDDVARLTLPDRVVWCDGTDEERIRLTAQAVAEGVLISLDQKRLPGCTLHRSHPNDVARSEHLTFICTPTSEQAGPTNNWMAPEEAYEKCGAILRGAMRGRTMYVVPYLMGPPGSPFSKVGIELTDSIYVVLNMRIMTRMGRIALDELGASEAFVRGVHSLGDLDPQRRMICHFPQDRTIWSVGSGYGGNALLGKKCFALRLGSWMAREEGWLAEHMLIMGLEDPRGHITYVAGAFPSACGKTNFAMMQPSGRLGGYKIHTIGDDIAWLRFGSDGRLWAINPEAGFFGVAPGTGRSTNPTALEMVSRNTIFTNVVATPTGTVWWEGMEPLPVGNGYYDWKGHPWNPDLKTPGAHPNARFTTPITQCATYSPKWEDPQGVPISAILFGARRSNCVPLVIESFDWAHGVYLGATLASETTAAAEGKTGQIRRDPMAMLPFCGYNMADYFAHWLKMGKGRDREGNGPSDLLGRQEVGDTGKGRANMPRIFRVNWFRKDENGRFVWPGFSENIRVLKWIVDRCEGRADAIVSPLGRLPAPGAIDIEGLPLAKDTMENLLAVDRAGWTEFANAEQTFFDRLGSRMPAELLSQRTSFLSRLRPS